MAVRLMHAFAARRGLLLNVIFEAHFLRRTSGRMMARGSSFIETQALFTPAPSPRCPPFSHACGTVSLAPTQANCCKVSYDSVDS